MEHRNLAYALGVVLGVEEKMEYRMSVAQKQEWR